MNEINTKVASVTEEIQKLTKAIAQLTKEVRTLGKVTKPKTPSPYRNLRPSNATNLKKAVLAVLKEKGPMTKREILDALYMFGYKFAARDPITSLHPLLYKKRNGFVHVGEKFSHVSSCRTAA